MTWGRMASRVYGLPRSGRYSNSMANQQLDAASFEVFWLESDPVAPELGPKRSLADTQECSRLGLVVVGGGTGP